MKVFLTGPCGRVGFKTLQALLDWASLGPPHATVVDTEVRWSPALGKFADFLITG